MLYIDAIVAEIGSTTTVVNAFCELNTSHPNLLGRPLPQQPYRRVM